MEETSIMDMMPNEWSTNHETKSFLVRCYHIVCLEKEDLPSSFKRVDLNGIGAIFLHGSVNYTKNVPITVENNVIKIEYNESELKSSTKIDNYLLLLSPWKPEGEEVTDTLSEHRISVAASLLAAFNGRNIIYEHIFDNIIGVNYSTTTPILTPAWNEKPNISDEGLEVVSNASDLISKLPVNEKNRVELSLKWFLSAINDNGVNAYLKYWIACETIGMPNETDVGALKKVIMKAYNIDNDKVNDFKIGELFGLRSAIVHEGEIIPIHGQLLKYIESLYIDILFEKLNIPIERKAEKILRGTDLRFKDYFPNLKRRRL